MGTKRRTVISADAGHIQQAEALVAAGRYRTLSDFVREAMDEKLARLEQEMLVDEVARYCATERDEAADDDLISSQALEPSRGRRSSRASR